MSRARELKITFAIRGCLGSIKSIAEDICIYEGRGKGAERSRRQRDIETQFGHLLFQHVDKKFIARYVRYKKDWETRLGD
jgi:hypothetical protein